MFSPFLFVVWSCPGLSLFLLAPALLSLPVGRLRKRAILVITDSVVSRALAVVLTWNYRSPLNPYRRDFP